MTRLVRLLAMLCIAAGLALVAAACSKAESCNGTGNCNDYGNNPLAPGTSNEVTGVQLTAWNKDITIGSGPCEADVTVEAKINPPSAPQKVDEWKVSAGEFVRTGDTTGVFKLRGAGTYTVTAIAQGKSVTETITLKCGAAQPPPGILEPSVDLKANGSDGPISVPINSDVRLDWYLERCPSGGTWIAGPLTGMVGGNGSQTIRVTQNIRPGMSCTGPGGTDVDYVEINVTTTTPPPPPPPPPPSLSCSGMNARYERTDGGSFTVRVNQNVPIRTVQQSGWLSHCEVFYGADRTSIIKALGTIPMEVCSGGGCFWYYGGKFGTVSGVWPGSAMVFSQIVILENQGQPNQRWVLASGSNMRYEATWNVLAATLDALGVKAPEGPKWVRDDRVPGGKVCLTFECR